MGWLNHGKKDGHRNKPLPVPQYSRARGHRNRPLPDHSAEGSMATGISHSPQQSGAVATLAGLVPGSESPGEAHTGVQATAPLRAQGGPSAERGLCHVCGVRL